MKIRKGDTVLVISGKDRGKKGKVRFAFPDEERVLVEGVNMIKRHTRARGMLMQAGIIHKEAPLHVSKAVSYTHLTLPTKA